MKFSGARPLGALASTAMMIVPILTGIVIAIVMTAGIALAAEPRPWLCRDKPVFSYDRGMEYEASARPGRQWQLFFMQFDPSGGHDGFTIVSQRDLGIRGEPLTGQLAAGRYFAVALYRAEGGYWVCPATARDSGAPKLGTVTGLCFSEGGPGCRVTLAVKPDHTLVPAGRPATP
jgi:hypothetical protein